MTTLHVISTLTSSPAHTSYLTVSESAPLMTCPVCRARQPLQSSCRRCEADLRLYVKALQSLQLAERQAAQAGDNSDPTAHQAAERYLRWLKGRN